MVWKNDASSASVLPNSLTACGVKVFLILLAPVLVTNRWQQPKQSGTGLARVSYHSDLLSAAPYLHLVHGVQYNVGMKEVNQSRETLLSDLIKRETDVQRISMETALSNTACVDV